MSNLMRRVPKASLKENQTNQQRNACEAERKVRVQFTKHVEELTSLKRNKQNKKQPSNPSTTGREELQSKAQRYDKNFQDLVDEVNIKTGNGYKIIEDSDRPNKLKVLFQQTVHPLEEKLPKQLQRRNKLVPYQANFVEEHLKKSKKAQSKFGLSLACIYQQRHATSNECRAKQHNSSSERQREE